jgi:hypothetical protein
MIERAMIDTTPGRSADGLAEPPQGGYGYEAVCAVCGLRLASLNTCPSCGPGEVWPECRVEERSFDWKEQARRHLDHVA